MFAPNTTANTKCAWPLIRQTWTDRPRFHPLGPFRSFIFQSTELEIPQLILFFSRHFFFFFFCYFCGNMNSSVPSRFHSTFAGWQSANGATGIHNNSSRWQPVEGWGGRRLAIIFHGWASLSLASLNFSVAFLLNCHLLHLDVSLFFCDGCDSFCHCHWRFWLWMYFSSKSEILKVAKCL